VEQFFFLQAVSGAPTDLLATSPDWLLRAHDEAYSDLAAVSNWDDQNAADNDAVQATPSSQPTFYKNLAAANNRSTVRGDGGDTMTFTALTPGGKFDMWFVYRAPAVELRNGATTQLRIVDTTTIRVRTSSTNLNFTVATLVVGTLYHLSWWYDGTKWHLALNKVESGTGQTGANSGAYNEIFTASTTDIAEIVHWNTVPDASNQAIIDAYSMNIYNVG